MKTCAYCGHENADDAIHCRECGKADFIIPAPPSPPQQPKIERRFDAPEPLPDVSATGETVLCTSCLFPNPPERPFCKRCGAPVSFISTIGPLEQVYAEGAAYRRAVQGRPKLIVLVGIWLIFFSCFLLCIGFMFSVFRAGIDGFGGFIFFWLFVGFGAICVAMLYRVTKNYFTISKQKPDETDA